MVFKTDEMNRGETEEHDEALIHREALKMYLDLFPKDYINVVDPALDKAITSQREVYKNHRANLILLAAKSSKNENEIIQNEFDQYYAKMSLTEVESEVFALYELKIMYACKYFEIQLKELSRIVFNDLPDGELYFDEIKEFYRKDKNIVFSKINNYYKVNELSRMNNSLKHSGRFVGKKIKNIPEFKGLTFLTLVQLKKFYERVQNAPKEFISALASAVYDQLFRDDTSTDISKEFDIQDNELILHD